MELLPPNCLVAHYFVFNTGRERSINRLILCRPGCLKTVRKVTCAGLLSKKLYTDISKLDRKMKSLLQDRMMKVADRLYRADRVEKVCWKEVRDTAEELDAWVVAQSVPVE